MAAQPAHAAGVAGSVHIAEVGAGLLSASCRLNTARADSAQSHAQQCSKNASASHKLKRA